MRRIDRLTDDQRAQMVPYAQKWISIGLRTTPLSEREWADWEDGARACYAAAKIPWPGMIIRVPAPIVGASAAPMARLLLESILRGPSVSKAVNRAVGATVDRAVDRAISSSVDKAVSSAVSSPVSGAVRGAVGDTLSAAVDTAVRGAVRGTVQDATDSMMNHAAVTAVSNAVVRGALDEAARGTVSGAVGASVVAAVGGTVGGAVNRAVRDTVDRTVREAVLGAVNDAVDDALDDTVSGPVIYTVSDTVNTTVNGAVKAVYDAARETALDTVFTAMNTPVDGTVNAMVGTGVSDAVNTTVSAAVREAVYGAVNGAVNETVSATVDRAVRDGVLDGVFDGVLDAVNDATDSIMNHASVTAVSNTIHRLTKQFDGEMRKAIRNGWSEFFGGNMWVGWTAWRSFFIHLGLELPPHIIALSDAWEKVSTAGWWWPTRDFIMVTELPSAIHRERVGPDGWRSHRLHNEDGPAVSWGPVANPLWAIWVWHGVQVPQDLVEDGWDAQRILSEPNAEIRRCAIERVGWDRFIAESGLHLVSSVPDPGNPGQTLELYELKGELQEMYEAPARILLCVNGTVERDGTRRKYGLPVPARHTDPVEAAAEQYDWPVEAYRQMARRA